MTKANDYLSDAEPIAVLLIDDDEDDYILTKDLLLDLSRGVFDIEWAPNYQKGLEALELDEHDIYLIDYRLGQESGLQLLKEAMQLHVKAPIIILTGKGDRDIDMEAMRYGAADYLVKGEIDTQALERAIRYSINNYKSARKINEQERLYRSLFEKSTDAIFVTSPELQFLEVNPAFVRILGYHRSAFKEMKLDELFEEPEAYERLADELQGSGVVKDMEAELTNEDQSSIIALVSLQVLTDEDGDVMGYQGIIKDITAIKQTEAELRNAERLSLVGNMARTIAHEIRNPLTNINLASSQLEDEVEGGEAEDYLEIIARNTRRIEDLITEMLNSSKMTSVELEPVNLNDVIQGAIEHTRDRMELKNVELKLELDGTIPEAMLDQAKLQMAMVNLIINAVEAMDKPEPWLAIKTARSGNSFLITVEDNAAGISKEAQKKLFEVFYTGKQKGMGLGLTTVQNTIKKHNGSIVVSSELGKGTIFSITIPNQQS